ncbi:dTDP-4-dehydrorhamnose reductase [Aetokthonos hydrillicola Thurmond2011]|jgi:dTDP-4-dehydrorhamnose reductase|uniref:dTDP-4-dehydrorhamnose reductase n=1 Tax=Aetokthonos hydrillicola Thurmond2011 TaxID=2712845 RepID=A0AAP5MBV5_9CYAN|nr:dTDP-4-dehydrorhamnose reductase [Aetokthonos hydrillicola]MBO3462341.1 dTDP-4-dehydrorhamnose reductase [Aetokthonos hydrillicola CCALA 1050]MBW4588832.1 dTDP-4-dehydrorhamnose reductase [Aetokthonos hydrillicola CCALA 1050]MDR9897304.1 dTDP-4-dehydrorhamnose reductase [Aetokthonos hydrillicola Thurmond2011]
MSKKILLIGSNGQVGKELLQILEPYENVIPITRSTVDITQSSSLCGVIREHQPEIIINAAAYTAVDKAESEPELAKTINGLAPGILAEEAEKLGAFLIHISTDYVFDGESSHPYRETDPTNPLSVYGETKLMGEQAIEKSCADHFILRTAWVYGTYGKSNFVKTMLRLGAEREEIRVVTDQIGSPTWARDIADAIAQIIPKFSSEIAGIYHYTNSGVASWYDFAITIFEEAQHLGFPLKVKRVIPITTSEYPTPARRPSYSVLSCGKISSILGIHPPHWRLSLRQMIQELNNQ